uniref:Uncharacterized protein n=1 Tax=Aegilops tauschii subsp. strangulata TaxID=200361 RepID=A0A453SND0_AEGTS
GFKEKDLYHLLEKVGTPSGADDLEIAEADGWRDQTRSTSRFWLVATSAVTIRTVHTPSRAQKAAPTRA